MSKDTSPILTPQECLNVQMGQQANFNKANGVKSEIEVVQSAGLRVLIHQVMKRLCKSFPGYDWLVSADDVGGTIDIYLPEMGGNMAYTLHIAKLDGHLKKVVNAGGQILERYGLRRDKMMVDDMAILERDFKGVAIQK